MIEALGLDDGAAKVQWTPDKSKPLFKDKDGVTMSGQFSHINIVIILMYIAGHNLLGIAYAVNCSERYMLGHRNSHGLAINRVGHHLKATRDKVLMLNPSHYLYKVE